MNQRQQLRQKNFPGSVVFGFSWLPLRRSSCRASLPFQQRVECFEILTAKRTKYKIVVVFTIAIFTEAMVVWWTKYASDVNILSSENTRKLFSLHYRRLICLKLISWNSLWCPWVSVRSNMQVIKQLIFFLTWRVCLVCVAHRVSRI